MATLYDHFDGDTNAGNLIFDAANDWGGQSFTTNVAFSITRVDVYISKGAGDNVGNIVVGIYATDDDGHPTGAALATGTIADADIPTVSDWVTCDFGSAANLSDTTKYCIVIHGPSCDGANICYWNYDDDGVGASAFADGDVEWSTTGGGAGSWATTTAFDCLFRCYGDTTPPTDKTYTKQLITIGNHEIWYESVAGTMAELAAANAGMRAIKPRHYPRPSVARLCNWTA